MKGLTNRACFMLMDNIGEYMMLEKVDDLDFLDYYYDQGEGM